MKLTRDMLAGALFFVLGACFLFAGRNYSFGTPTSMGPGYFPAIVSGGVMIFGFLTALRSYLRDEGVEIAFNFDLRPFLCIFGAVVVFALLIESAGLVVTLAATIVVSRLAAPNASLLELLGLVLGISAVIIGIFVCALGVPFTLGF